MAVETKKSNIVPIKFCIRERNALLTCQHKMALMSSARRPNPTPTETFRVMPSSMLREVVGSNLAEL